MKKNIILGSFLWLFLVNYAYGQLKDKPPVETKNPTILKTRLLLNLATTSMNFGSSNEELKSYKKSLIGLQLGISTEKYIDHNVSILGEFYFLMKGAELKKGNPLTNSKYKIRLNTFELPLIARLYLGKFHFNAGPYVTYNLSGSEKLNNEKSKISFGTNEDEFNRWETGLQLGGGYRFNISKTHITFDFRYLYGLTNISNNGKLYNRGFLIGLRFDNMRNDK